MTAVLISLLASVCWGCADFAGGIYSRRMSVLGVLVLVEGAGLIAIVVVALFSGESPPDASVFAIAAAAGLSGVTGLGLFYRALAVGPMSLVAPVAASGAAVPALYGVATGDPLTLLLGSGLGIAMAGVMLASIEAPEAETEDEHAASAEHPSAAPSRLGLLLAAGAAAGFGGYFILFDRVADDSVVWSLVGARSAPVLVLVVLILVCRVPLPAGRDRLVLAGAGLLDVSATGLYGLALTRGALSVVSVVGSLYPVTTVLLARVILHERVRPVQGAGIALALGGVALISAA